MRSGRRLTPAEVSKPSLERYGTAMSKPRTVAMSLIAAALAATASAATASDYSCHSVAGDEEGAPPAEVSFTLTYSSNAYAVIKAAFQIEGDIGYSTVATEPTSLATVTGVVVDDDVIEFSLHYTGDGYDGDIAKLHVVTLSEGAHAITAGAFHAVGGGLYAVVCESTE
jgi:hypothetical protein